MKSKRKRVRVKESLSIGDKVEQVIKTTGIKKLADMFINGEDCGCEERKKSLNNIGRYLSARCMTEQEFIKWGEFMKVRTLRLSGEQVTYVGELYSSLFNLKYTNPCRNCSPKQLIKMIESIDKVYNVYNN